MNAKGKQLTDFEIALNRRLNILLVDDDDVCIFIHRWIAERSGFFRKIRSASNGQRALDILNQACKGTIAVPDIILLDLNMPVMNGLAFMEAFQRLDFENKDWISIIILTSSVSEKEKQCAESLGARHYLTKPFTLEHLKSVVYSIYKSNSELQVMLPHPATH